MEVKLLGSFGARQYLRQMGIPEETSDEALVDYDELESARRLLDKKLRALKGQPLAVARRRLTGYLQRRGYKAETVRRTIKNYELGIKN